MPVPEHGGACVATQAAVEANVDLVGEMLGEVCNRMVVESAAAYVTSGQMNITAQNTIRDAVRSRMDRFDQVTLSVLTSLVESTAAPDDAETHSLLIALRAEIVKQVGGTLPEELQTLNALAALTEQKERRELLSVRISTVSRVHPLALTDAGNPDVSRVQAKDEETLDSTGRAAEQLINEMEELPAIPDVRLLARLVVVFEEVYAAMDGVRGGAAGELRTLRPNVPAAIATFVSQLLKVGDPVARRAQIYTCALARCLLCGTCVWFLELRRALACAERSRRDARRSRRRQWGQRTRTSFDRARTCRRCIR